MASRSATGVVGEEFVVRRPLMVSFGIVVPIIWFFGVSVTFTEMAARDLSDAFFAPVIFSGFQVFFWSIAWRSSIRVGRGGLKVRNMFYVTEVPWAMVREIALDNGLEIVLKDDSVIGSIHFGGSVIGAITGFPTYRSSVQKLQRAHRSHLESNPASSGGELGECSGRLVLPVVDFAVFYVLLVLPMSIRLLTL